MPGKLSRVDRSHAVVYNGFNLSKLLGLGLDPS